MSVTDSKLAHSVRLFELTSRREEVVSYYETRCVLTVPVMLALNVLDHVPRPQSC